MDSPVRSLLSFSCEDSCLGASFDAAEGATGVLIVTGGTQTRIGSHRLFERLAHALAQSGYPCFRFDRRGIGDSEGTDPGFRDNAADIAAAAASFRTQAPAVRRLFGLGLCDGATSLALFGSGLALDGLVLINPWMVEAEANAPPPAAIKRHYRKQLLSLDGWKRIATGAVSYRKLLKGIRKIAGRSESNSLAREAGEGLARLARPVELILARDDATAVAAEHAWQSASFRRSLAGVPVRATHIETNAHTFARPGDFGALLRACLASIERLERSGGD